MSVRSLNRRIEHRSREMALQRRCALRLMRQQKDELSQQAKGIPLPAVLGLALAGGFVAERLSHTRAPSNLLRLYLAWRTF